MGQLRTYSDEDPFAFKVDVGDSKFARKRHTGLGVLDRFDLEKRLKATKRAGYVGYASIG